MEILEKAYAKLNISLDVCGKRSDGYHEMKMIMQSISLCDNVTLSLRDDDKIVLKSNLYYLPNDERNIAYKSAKAFLEYIGKSEVGVNISINKYIPVCAGMGGGSSDGAAVLRGLNKLFKNPLSLKELEDIGAGLGADIPFCISCGTKLATGKGEILEDLKPLPPCYIVVVKPRFSVSTPALFKKLDSTNSRFHPDTQGILNAIEDSSLDGICCRLFNVFEDCLGDKKSIIDEIKNNLVDMGAKASVMTGTGSAVFGIFADEFSAKTAKKKLSRLYPEVFIGKPTNKLEIE